MKPGDICKNALFPPLPKDPVLKLDQQEEGLVSLLKTLDVIENQSDELWDVPVQPSMNSAAKFCSFPNSSDFNGQPFSLRSTVKKSFFCTHAIIVPSVKWKMNVNKLLIARI